MLSLFTAITSLQYINRILVLFCAGECVHIIHLNKIPQSKGQFKLLILYILTDTELFYLHYAIHFYLSVLWFGVQNCPLKHVLWLTLFFLLNNAIQHSKMKKGRTRHNRLLNSYSDSLIFILTVISDIPVGSGVCVLQTIGITGKIIIAHLIYIYIEICFGY